LNNFLDSQLAGIGMPDAGSNSSHGVALISSRQASGCPMILVNLLQLVVSLRAALQLAKKFG
jgi:hypothetical protein